MIARRHFHRVIFVAAGLYNIVWGLYAVIDPQWLFRFARMPHENYPPVFACLGMVLGLYGVLYLEVARVPERGWAIAAVGLTGKVFGPIGLARLICTGIWPGSDGDSLCDQRPDLVGSFQPLFVRCLACLPEEAASGVEVIPFLRPSPVANCTAGHSRR